jgi:hypothetical protein
MRDKKEKLELAQGFVYLAIIGIAIFCLPAIWEIICGAFIVVLQGIACAIILLIVLTILESMVVWIAAKAKGEDNTWQFA